jgi:beta-glucosidase
MIHASFMINLSACLLALAVTGAVAVGESANQPEAIDGFTNTPMEPYGQWHVHDPNRPQPRVVTPGAAFSENAPPPSDAEMLFDGTDLSKWEMGDGKEAKWHVRDGFVETQRGGGIRTRGKWADFQLHVEFSEPNPPHGASQGRGNSGILINNMYEVQVLDSYQAKTYPDGQCGAIYGQQPPLVNACKAPGEWQTYDIIFESPRWDKNGDLTKRAVITVIQNGVVVQNHYELIGMTDGINSELPWKSASKYPPAHSPEVFIELQDHNNPVRFRNIWVRTLGEEAPVYAAPAKTVYLDESKPIEERVADLLPRLTLEEKVGMVHARSTFANQGVPRLGIPDLWMDDGPMGVREEVGEHFRNLNRSDDFATAMPATLGLAASFNTALAVEYGSVIGQEAKQRHKDVMLGPSLNIQRTPLCGRNFEYLGEDPFLTSQIGVHYIEGEQAQGVASCAKHFVANNQEHERSSINVEMDERTLREIYLPAFKACVQQAGVLTVMGAYNKFRGEHCCENDYLLNTVLKNEWGFKGLVMSDWGGVHSTDLAAMNGMDLEMGTRPPYDSNYLAEPFLEGLKSGKYPMSVLDDKVGRILYVMFKLNLIQDPNAPATNSEDAGVLSTKAHQDIARRVAEEAIVLLKNDGLLPLNPAKIKTIAVIGANADAKFAHGGGAAIIKAPFEITALEGISNRVGSDVKIIYAQGYTAPAGRGRRDKGDKVPPPPKVNADLISDAVAAAKSADVVIYVGGLNHNGGYDTEGTDRPNLKLPGGQDELLDQIVKANPKTVVVFMGGGAVEMGPWLKKTPALLYAWYPGMEGGNALARVIFGDVNPSGKLPCTFPKRLDDSPAHALDAYPGTNGTVTYKEGLLVGYRWFDTKNIEPLFPFGYGLSYTTFKYSKLKIIPDKDQTHPGVVTVEFEIANTGDREGAEVAQIYVEELKPSVMRPVKELKQFVKVSLQPGESRKVSLQLDRRAFAYYDPEKNAWVAEKGDYRILVGASSRDITLRGKYNLPESLFEPD